MDLHLLEQCHFGQMTKDGLDRCKPEGLGQGPVGKHFTTAACSQCTSGKIKQVSIWRQTSFRSRLQEVIFKVTRSYHVALKYIEQHHLKVKSWLHSLPTPKNRGLTQLACSTTGWQATILLLSKEAVGKQTRSQAEDSTARELQAAQGSGAISIPGGI